MEHDHLQENAEYAVNNVKYQVSASFQTPDDKIPTEDFADKLKRLILSEDVMNRSGKSNSHLCVLERIAVHLI